MFLGLRGSVLLSAGLVSTSIATNALDAKRVAEFQAFWASFRAAVIANDEASVIAVTHFPFRTGPVEGHPTTRRDRKWFVRHLPMLLDDDKHRQHAPFPQRGPHLHARSLRPPPRWSYTPSAGRCRAFREAGCYMIIEHFRDGDPLPVYRRFRDQGRLAPEGLRYVASWVTEDLRRCFQIMECEDRALLTRFDRPLGGPDRVRGDSGRHVGGSGGQRCPSVVIRFTLRASTPASVPPAKNPPR